MDKNETVPCSFTIILYCCQDDHLSTDYIRKTLVYSWARDVHSTLPFSLSSKSDLPSLVAMVSAVVLAGAKPSTANSTLEQKCDLVFHSYLKYVLSLREKALWVRNQLRIGKRNDIVASLNAYNPFFQFPRVDINILRWLCSKCRVFDWTSLPFQVSQIINPPTNVSSHYISLLASGFASFKSS